jgi:hypothetical protein
MRVPAKRGSSALSCALLAALLAPVGDAAAQGARPTVSCSGQQISGIEIITRAPYEGNGDQWWAAPLRIATQAHVTTRERIVRRYLLLHEGGECIERMRAESERLLRAQPYLADALITVLSDAAGGVVLRVVTTDELTAILGLRAETDSPWLTGLSLGEGNVDGRAIHMSATWRSGLDRDHWSGRFAHYQFMGRPWILELAGARRDPGFDEWTVSASYPFFTGAQRFGWRASVTQRSEIFDLWAGDDKPVGVALTSEFATLGALARVGSPERHSLFGLALTSERARVSPTPAGRQIATPYDPVTMPFEGRASRRLNALFGLRALNYLRVERFEALNTPHDVARGGQVGVVLARSASWLGSTENDLLVAADAYAGMGSERSFTSLHIRAEARDHLETDRWDGILASATLDVWHRPHPRHTVAVEANWSAGWRQQVPFQLPIGSRLGGVRGFVDGREAGGQRVMLSVEDRWYLGAIRGLADLGVAAFLDAGVVQAGDLPIGTTSPVRVGAGVGILTALPAGSGRTWRLDLAMPINSDGHARWEVRLSSMDARRAGWKEPPEVTRSREQAVPMGLFSWP